MLHLLNSELLRIPLPCDSLLCCLFRLVAETGQIRVETHRTRVSSYTRDTTESLFPTTRSACVWLSDNLEFIEVT